MDLRIDNRGRDCRIRGLNNIGVIYIKNKRVKK
jgi:hypothetical protein